MRLKDLQNNVKPVKDWLPHELLNVGYLSRRQTEGRNEHSGDMVVVACLLRPIVTTQILA